MTKHKSIVSHIINKGLCIMHSHIYNCTTFDKNIKSVSKRMLCTHDGLSLAIMKVTIKFVITPISDKPISRYRVGYATEDSIVSKQRRNGKCNKRIFVN